MPEHITLRWILKALTPPIVVIAVKGLLRRLGLPTTGLPLDVRPEPLVESAEAPEFEVLPEGWAAAAGGWDAGAVADAYVAKWPEWVAALEGAARSACTTRHVWGESIVREDLAAHNMLLSFASSSPRELQPDATGSRCSTGEAVSVTTPSSRVRCSPRPRSSGIAARCPRSRQREQRRIRT